MATGWLPARRLSFSKIDNGVPAGARKKYPARMPERLAFLTASKSPTMGADSRPIFLHLLPRRCQKMGLLLLRARRDIAFLGTVMYLFPLSGSSLSPYAGGGLGLHHFSYDVVKYNWMTMQLEKCTESSNKVEFHLLGGVEYPVSPQITAFGEFKYVSGDVDYSGVYGGITYYLGTSGGE